MNLSFEPNWVEFSNPKSLEPKPKSEQLERDQICPLLIFLYTDIFFFIHCKFILLRALLIMIKYQLTSPNKAIWQINNHYFIYLKEKKKLRVLCLERTWIWLHFLDLGLNWILLRNWTGGLVSKDKGRWVTSSFVELYSQFSEDSSRFLMVPAIHGFR